MSQSSHINSNLMNSTLNNHHHGDAQQNENENDLIGNILAEDEDNSGSDIEDNKLLSAASGSGVANYIINANNGSGGAQVPGNSNIGAGPTTGGFGQLSSKLTAFGGASGSFGLPGSSPYGGAFNNTGIPDRVGSSLGADLSTKYYDSPTGKKLSHHGTSGSQNQSAFSNLFPQSTSSDHFTQQMQSQILDPLNRRQSAGMMDGLGFNTGQNPGTNIDGSKQQQVHMNLHQIMSPMPSNSNVVPGGSANNFNSENPNSSQQAFLGMNTSDPNQQQQNMYATKDYYDYYHKLQDRDPRLPMPQYTPLQGEIEQSIKNNSSQNQGSSDEIEKKLSQLSLNNGSLDSQNNISQSIGPNPSQALLSTFGGNQQPLYSQGHSSLSLDQNQLSYPLQQQYPLNPLLFGQSLQNPLNIQPQQTQPLTSQQSAQALLQQLTQQHMNSTGASQTQLQQAQNNNPGTQQINQVAQTGNPTVQNKGKKFKKGGAAQVQDPPPMPKPPGQQPKSQIGQVAPNSNTVAQNQQNAQNRMNVGQGQTQQVVGQNYSNFPQNTYGTNSNQIMGTGISSQAGIDNKSQLAGYQGWQGQPLQQASQTLNAWNLLNNVGGQQVSLAGGQNLAGNLLSMAGTNQLGSSGTFPTGFNAGSAVAQTLPSQSLFNQAGLFGASQSNLLGQNPLQPQIPGSNIFAQGDQQQQAALLMQNYAAMGMSIQNPYTTALLMNRMMQAQIYPGTSATAGQSTQYPLQNQAFGQTSFVGQQMNLHNQTGNFNAQGQQQQNQDASGYRGKGGFSSSVNQGQSQQTISVRGGSATGLGRGGRGTGNQQNYPQNSGNQGMQSQGSGRGMSNQMNRGGDHYMMSQNPLYQQSSIGRADSNSQYSMDPMDPLNMPGGIQQAKSEFLEDLRNKIQNGKKIEINEIKDHVVECSMDQYGSRFIQQKYDVTTEEEKELIFSEILPEANSLMNDVFGNYVVQKLFEYGTEFQRATLADQLLGNVLKLTKSMYGCRVVQKALEVISLDQKKLLVQELKDSVIDCIYDQNGNHVIQKCIERMPSDQVDFIVQTILEKPHQVRDLCLHTYGCRVIQRILEKCHDAQTVPIIDSILADIAALTKDQFGNYVIQHILEQGTNQEDKNRITMSIKGRVIELSNHKFASNVVEKCLQHGSPDDKREIIDEFLESNYELGEEVTSLGGPQLNGALYTMMKDRYGNYVIQKCIEVSKGKQREILIKKITACANVLRKQQNYSRHVYNFIERFSPIEASEGQIQIQDQQLMDTQNYQAFAGGSIRGGRGGNNQSQNSGGSYSGNSYVDNQRNGGGGNFNNFGQQNHHQSNQGSGAPQYVQKRQQHGGAQKKK